MAKHKALLILTTTTDQNKKIKLLVKIQDFCVNFSQKHSVLPFLEGFLLSIKGQRIKIRELNYQEEKQIYKGQTH